MSKGDSRRPAQVSAAHVRAEYERIFAKKEPQDTSAIIAQILREAEAARLENLGWDEYLRLNPYEPVTDG